MRPSLYRQEIVLLLTDHDGMTIGEISRRTGISYNAVGSIVRHSQDFTVAGSRYTAGQKAKVYALVPKCDESVAPPKRVAILRSNPQEELAKEQAALAQAVRVLLKRGKTDEAKIVLDLWRDGDEVLKRMINGIFLPEEDKSQSH